MARDIELGGEIYTTKLHMMKFMSLGTDHDPSCLKPAIT